MKPGVFFFFVVCYQEKPGLHVQIGKKEEKKGTGMQMGL